jgi:Ran GTPase-activating protein (RanGAP) involved in mRNA processing and transport
VILDQQKDSTQERRSKSKSSVAQSSSTATAASVSATSVLAQSPILLEPLLQSLSEINYQHVRCLHIWNVTLSEKDLVSLALFMVNPVGIQIRVLDLTGTNMSVWGIQRVSRSFANCQLVHVTLDYNRLTRECISSLCYNLRNCLSLLSLNLNYCHLTADCGESLGMLVTSTQLRYLGLQGNYLQSAGLTKLLSCITAVSETNELLPLLEKLHIQDNCIDGCGSLNGENGIYSPVACMQAMARWLIRCKNIEEVRLEGNLIGDSAARELLLSLQQRKEADLPAVKVSITNKINSDLFVEILSLTDGRGGKKKGKKKKGKKK